MTLQDKKKRRIEFIMYACNKAWKEGKKVDEKKLIAMMCLRFGAAERYIKEIIRQLENIEFLKKERGVITKGEKTLQEVLNL